jgi:hypothetical protein
MKYYIMYTLGTPIYIQLLFQASTDSELDNLNGQEANVKTSKKVM